MNADFENSFRESAIQIISSVGCSTHPSAAHTFGLQEPPKVPTALLYCTLKIAAPISRGFYDYGNGRIGAA
jgi:hypothetical protein